MKPIVLFASLLVALSGYSQGYQLPLDSTYANPFYRASDVIGTKDVVVIYDDPVSNENNPPLSARIIGNGTSLAEDALDHSLGTSSYNHRQLAVATGDFNGDGKEEFAYAFEGPSQSIRLRIVGLDDALQIDYSPEVSSSQAYPSTFDDLPFSPTRIVTSDFNGDGKDEIVLIHRNHQDSKMKITVYGFDTGSQTIVLYGTQNDLFLRAGNYLPEGLDALVDDFDYDGTDEIVIYGYGGQLINSNQFFIAIYRVDLDGTNAVLTGTSYTQVSGSDTSYLRMVSGDFNGDLVPEIALIQSTGSNTYVYIHRVADNTVSTPTVVDFTELIQMAGSSISGLYTGMNNNEYPNGPGNEDDFFIDEYPYYTDQTILSLDMEAGDINLDGKDDIVIANIGSVIVWFGNGLQYPMLNNETFVFDGVQGIPGPYVRDFLRVDDLNLDGKEEIIVLRNERISADEQRMAVHFLRFNNNSITSLGSNTFAQTSFDASDVASGGRMFALASGDLTGDSYTLGKPEITAVNGIVQPIIVLNSPPVHSDNIGAENWVDVAGCFDNDCSFSATYLSETSQSVTVESEVHSAWTVGASIGGGFNVGVVGVEAKLETTYGENFSNMAAFGQTWTQVISASTVYDDLVYSSVTDYDLREYPVYQGGQIISYVSSIKPKTTTFQWLPGKSDDMINYRPKHENGNILSYRSYGVNVDQNPDNNETLWGETIYEVGPSVDYTWDVTFGEISSTSASTSRDLSISASLNASVYGVEAGLSGSYSMGSVSTHSSSVEANISIGIEMSPFADGLSDGPYKIYPYLYWGNDGTITLDYTVEPNEPSLGTDNLWSTYYDIEDPSWNLPWRLDTERNFGITNPSKRRLSKSFWMTQFLNGVPNDVPLDNPYPGDTVVVHARVFNYSTEATASSIPVRFYMGHPWNNGLLLVDIYGDDVVSTTGAIDPLGYKELRFIVKLPDDIDLDGRIYGRIDADSTITEVHEENNLGWIAAGIHFPIYNEPDFNVGVDEMTAAVAERKIYPNPARDILRLSGEFDPNKNVSVYFYNTIGAQVKSPVIFMPGQSRLVKDIAVNDLSDGLYQCIIVQGDKTSSHAVMVQR